MPAVLGQLAEHVEVDPPQRQRAATVAADDAIQPELRRRPAGGSARIAVSLLDGGRWGML
ncbi:hypothetical protein GCM10023169_24820 [Georgenia halophila]|uniref:Uncharacterized protein n=1 Tax=Georgenia halophila TaxID=620889 RepID=A0ABP8LC99_9MICO